MAITYRIYQNGTKIDEVTGLTATISNLQPNTKYSFHVTETDGDDESAKSNVVEFTTAAIPVASIALNASTKALAKGSTFQLTATVLPANATNKTVTWTSSDSTKVSVSSSGLITALKSGTATITAKTNNNKTATCAVTVTAIVKTPTNLVASDVTATSVKLTWAKGV